MPEPTSIPVRPRPRKAAPASTGTNGTHPRVEVPQPLRNLTHAIEDLHIAAKAMNLAPIRVDWQEPDRTADEDPERRAMQRYVETMLGDYEGLRAGPIATPLSEIRPPDDPHAFLVGNLIRPGTTVMLTGPPGAAKSWASRQLALAAGAGLPIFLERYPIDRQLNVMVVDEDNGPDEEWRRDETLLTHLDLRRDQVANVRRVSLEGVKLDAEPWQRWLRGQIRLHNLDLVILDPISEMHGGKELREDPSFRSLLAFLKRLKVDFPRLATILVHHTRKLPSNERSSSRGLEDVRGQWGQTPDVVAMLSPLGERRARWEVHKRVPHSALILEQIAEGQPGEGALRMVADESIQKSKVMANDDAVIDAIRGGFEHFSDIQEAIGMAPGTLSGVFKRLMRTGLVVRSGRGRGATYSVPEDE